MKTRYVLTAIVLLIFISCSGEKQDKKNEDDNPDRLALLFHDITEIATLRELTSDQRDLNPFFNSSGTEIYFSRLLTPSMPDTARILDDAIESYYSYDLGDNKLYMLKTEPTRVTPTRLPPDSLPKMATENVLFGIRVNDTVYFCASGKAGTGYTNIYRFVADSLVQLTYGAWPSYLESISPDGKYMVFYYGQDLEHMVIMDLTSDLFYEIPKPHSTYLQHDFFPDFSPDGSKLVFVRSGNKFSRGKLPFGDLWLVEFR